MPAAGGRTTGRVVLALKAKVESLDGVPEEAHDFYVQDGDIYRLDAEGVEFEEDVQGLKSALEKERDARKALEGKLPKDFDPDEYKTLKQQAEERERREAEERGEWEKLREKLKQEHQETVEELEQEMAKRDNAITRLTVERELTEAISRVGVRDEYRQAVKALLERAGPTVEQTDDGYRGVFPDDLHGNKPIGEYVEEWAESEEAEPFLAATNATGGGASGRSPGGAATKSLSEMSENERMDFIDQHGIDRYRELVAGG